MNNETKRELERRQDTTSYNFFIVSYEDIKGKTRTYVQTCRSGRETMYKAGKVICFSDCSGERVDTICANGHLVHYTGWQPNMMFSFANEDGEEVFNFFASEWDH